jgi:hypothetical protein
MGADSVFGSQADKEAADSARDADADRQLAEGKFKMFKGGRGSGWDSARPENAELDDREIEAIERENGPETAMWRMIAITGRARRAADGGNHKR